MDEFGRSLVGWRASDSNPSKGRGGVEGRQYLSQTWGRTTVRVVDETSTNSQGRTSCLADTLSIGWQEVRDDTKLEGNLGEQQVEFRGYQVRYLCEFVEKPGEDDYDVENGGIY